MKIKKLYIDKNVTRMPETEIIRERMGIPSEIVHDKDLLFRKISEAADPVQAGKQALFLTENKGPFLKECPGTRHYTCCGYKILHIGSYCNLDCAYCILQAYFHPPMLQYFVNHDNLFREIETVFEQKRVVRIGTGEFTDSLIWEPWTDLNRNLIHHFSNQAYGVLELKSKTPFVEKLGGIEHNRKSIISWSLNTHRIIQKEERGTTSLKTRLKEAARCVSWGYPVAFHFDPIVIYEGCEDEYRQVIQELFAAISPDDIVWISLGSFRFMPDLKSIIQRRFPDSKIIYGEFVSGLDGKMRYFKPLRIKVYQTIIECIRGLAPDVVTYFCMEDDEVWMKTMGFTPAERGGLTRMLDMSALRHCGLNPDGLSAADGPGDAQAKLENGATGK